MQYFDKLYDLYIARHLAAAKRRIDIEELLLSVDKSCPQSNISKSAEVFGENETVAEMLKEKDLNHANSASRKAGQFRSKLLDSLWTVSII